MLFQHLVELFHILQTNYVAHEYFVHDIELRIYQLTPLIFVKGAH